MIVADLISFCTYGCKISDHYSNPSCSYTLKPYNRSQT